MPARPDRAHLCGSVPLAGAEAAFRTCAAELAGHVRRLPDGETGKRLHWVEWQLPRLQTEADLESLRTTEETAVYLGLVHATDGVEGGLRRVAATREVLVSFGIGTECGMGRRTAERIPDLLRLHAKLADAL